VNSDSARKIRKLIQFAIGMAVLVLAGWILTAWMPQAPVSENESSAAANTAMESGDSPEPSAQARSHLRKTQQPNQLSHYNPSLSKATHPPFTPLPLRLCVLARGTLRQLRLSRAKTQSRKVLKKQNP
jgi:hypothetical protein